MDAARTMPESPSALVLADVARELVRRKHGRLGVAVDVCVRLDEDGEFSGWRVEVVGPVAAPATIGINDCLRDVIVCLAQSGHRLTTTKLLEALTASGLTWGESTVKHVCAQAVKDNILTSNERARPHPGYGLPGFP